MSEYRITIHHHDGRESHVTVTAGDHAEAIGRASAQAEPPTGPSHGRVTVEPVPLAA